MPSRLIVQHNGMITAEHTAPGCVRYACARDLRYVVQLRYPSGWSDHSGEFSDEITVRQVYREVQARYPRYRWRLRARAEAGEVTVPRGWRGWRG